MAQAIQYGDLRDIDFVEPINESDDVCLREVAEVLARHGRQDRFGIALLHKHFDLADDEVLVETCDKDSRTLKLRPVKTSAEEAQAAVATIWTCGGEVAQACVRRCVVGKDGKHYGYKDHQ